MLCNMASQLPTVGTGSVWGADGPGGGLLLLLLLLLLLRGIDEVQGTQVYSLQDRGNAKQRLALGPDSIDGVAHVAAGDVVVAAVAAIAVPATVT